MGHEVVHRDDRCVAVWQPRSERGEEARNRIIERDHSLMAWITPGVTRMRSIRAVMVSFPPHAGRIRRNLVTLGQRHAVTEGRPHSSRHQEACKAT